MKKMLAFVLAFALVAGASLPMNTGNILKSDTGIVAHAVTSCYVQNEDDDVILYLAGNVTSVGIRNALDSKNIGYSEITKIVADSSAVLPENCDYLFAGKNSADNNLFVNVKNIDLSLANASSVQSAERMFYKNSSLTTLNISCFNPENIDGFWGKELFLGCTGLTTITLSHFPNGVTENMKLDATDNWYKENSPGEVSSNVGGYATISETFFNSAGSTTFYKGNGGNSSGNSNTGEEDKDMTVALDVQGSYTITIPATVALSSTESTTAVIQADGVMIAEGKAVYVKLSGASNTGNGSSTFCVKNGNSEATYTISNSGGSNIHVGEDVATFPADSSTALTFSKAEGATHAGNHTETLTFTFEVKDLL